jgi:hypothetical protein
MQNAQLTESVEGFWTVVFSTGSNSNGGVAVFTSGNIYGGDNAFFYVGKYTIESGKISGTIDCRAFTKNATNIFGTQLDSFSLNIEGLTASNHTIAAIGKVALAPHLAINIRMTKRCELI